MNDKLKLAAAILLVIAGLVGYYYLAGQSGILRVGSVVLGILFGLTIAWLSEPGKQFVGFAQESWTEAKKVVWPSRKETIQTTMIVFAFVVVMAIFLWFVDYVLWELSKYFVGRS
jgi:preprotein translocase subunit SecE